MPSSVGTQRGKALWSDYSLTRPGAGRLIAARASAVLGAILGNWWLAYLLVPGLLHSVNAFFSNIEATGQPHAALLQNLDLAGGTLIVAAVLLRGPMGRGEPRAEWNWVLLYGLAGAVGGIFPYACAEGIDHGCRVREWSLQLPPSHYVHILSGILEFGAATWAAWLLRRRFRTRTDAPGWRRAFKALVIAFAVMYPLLGFAYLTDRIGGIVEPLFFAAFTFVALFEVFEPA